MTYKYYKNLFKGKEMPFAFIDLDVLEENTSQLLNRSGDKSIRLATKSIRCRTILDKLLDASPQINGLMCFTAPEAVWLSEQGYNDLLIAYPTVHPEHLRLVAGEVKKGKRIYLMTDKSEHIEGINEVGKAENVVLPVCLDIDMSSKFPGLHFGVHRSSINSLDKVKDFITTVKTCDNVALKALMGYEAQIAGLGDNVPGQRLKNKVVRRLKQRSLKEITQRREAIVQYIKQEGITLDLVNGGGTGSLETTILEEGVTEVTIGSGFYTSTLFDNYQKFRHLPAAVFAIEVVRQPTPDIYTCLGGGYVASGSANIDKIPAPYLPEGCKLTQNEMAGEVQTPIVYSGKDELSIGDPVFMRHSKAGELCERFNTLYLISKGKIVDQVPTYRGEGKAFL